MRMTAAVDEKIGERRQLAARNNCNRIKERLGRDNQAMPIGRLTRHVRKIT